MPRAPAILSLFAAALTSCGAANLPATQSAGLDTEVMLAPGSSITFEPADTVVQFVGVTEDSRCPREVTCMWAGEVKVRLSVRTAEQPPVSHEVLEGEHAASGDYRINVVRVQPEPITSNKIPPEDYRVTLQLQKAQAEG